MATLAPARPTVVRIDPELMAVILGDAAYAEVEHVQHCDVCGLDRFDTPAVLDAIYAGKAVAITADDIDHMHDQARGHVCA